MLDPDHRQLYTDALRPPPGFRFTEAVATTYSLNLELLLTIPLHLALFSAEQPMEELLRDGVTLLEAIRRTADHVTVFGQAGAVHVPGNPNVLYGLLEPAVVEVTPPSGTGLFHPKLWLIRFDHPGRDTPRLRLLVLSRNITADRCWDLVLTMDGSPGRDPVKDNRQLHELLRGLPAMARRPLTPDRLESTNSMAELALRAAWEPPSGFDRVRFHSIGLNGRDGWLPEKSGRLAVISPFLTVPALRDLIGSTRHPQVLVSRPEDLATIDPAILEQFERVMVLADQAELEDGEEVESSPDPRAPVHGLHAKAYVTKRGWDTHVYVGSANATSPALVHGTNVELMAELIGKRSKVGAVGDLLDAEQFGGVLMDYVPDPDQELPDPAVEEAQEMLGRARRDLVDAGLRLRFESTDDGWRAEVLPSRPVRLEGVVSSRAWLVTRKPETATDAAALADGAPVLLDPSAVQHVTSFVAFELAAEAMEEERLRFVLSLGAEGMPVAERDAAVVRDVIRNRDGFLRYAMLLLAEAGEGADVFGAGASPWGRPDGARATADDAPVFEHLTRAFCRDPERLEAVRRLLEEIGTGEDGAVVPPEFRELWEVFEAAVTAAEIEEMPA